MKHILNHRLHDNHKHGDSECRYFVTVEFEMVDNSYFKSNETVKLSMVRTLLRMYWSMSHFTHYTVSYVDVHYVWIEMREKLTLNFYRPLCR